jgi:ABC-2 type transport system permease protein
VITGGLLTVVAIVIGMDVGGSGVDIVGLYTLALLVNVCGLLWAAGIALRFRSIQAAPLMQMPVFLALFFAPVYVPLDLLNGWIETVATFNPVTYFLEAGRSLIAGDPTEVALAFGVALALMAVLAVWGIRGLHRAEAAG